MRPILKAVDTKVSAVLHTLLRAVTRVYCDHGPQNKVTEMIIMYTLHQCDLDSSKI